MNRRVRPLFILLSLVLACIPAGGALLHVLSDPDSTAVAAAGASTGAGRAMSGPVETRTLSANASSPPLPSLYVDGPYIKRADTRTPVWLKGANIEEFRQASPHTFDDLYDAQGLSIVIGQKWGINLLRVAVDPESARSTAGELDRLIEFAQSSGMYVALTPFASAVNPSRSEAHLAVPDDLVAAAMGYLAGRFKDRTNVLYGLWNEPHPDSIQGIGYEQQWQTWMNAGIKVAAAIRSRNPRSILVVPAGNKWARDMVYYQYHPFPFDNVVYDVHDYWAYPDYHYTREMWTWAIGRYPLLIGEFGGDPVNPSDGSALSYMQETLRIADEHPGLVHYAVYALSSDGVWGIFTRDLTNMPKGTLLRSDLSAYPPTRFR